MAILYFLISFMSSTIGAITGIGGGIIIKPVLDLTGLMSVSSISFLSGCTVLSMTVVSLLKNIKSGIKIDTKRATFLAIGSAVGGLLGKYIFDIIKIYWGSDNLLGFIQAGILCLLNIGVFMYMLYKEKVKTYDVENIFWCTISGLLLEFFLHF